MRRKPIVVLAVLLAVVAGIWLLVANRPPAESGAKLSASTPATQNGYTFLAVRPIDAQGLCTYQAAPATSWLDRLLARFRRAPVQTGQVSAYADFRYAGGLGLWVREPASRPAGAVGATARFPDGTSLALLPQAQSLGGSTLLFFSVPGGYPDSFKHVELALTEATGRTSRWRVVDLPPSRHAVFGPPAPRQKLAEGDMEVTGRAWWTPSPGTGAFEKTLVYELKATGRPLGPLHWEIYETGVQPEWQPSAGSTTRGTSTTQWSRLEAQLGSQATFYYGAHNRTARVEGGVTAYEALDETVTFRDLPVISRGNLHYVSLNAPRSARTPSGLTVTLPAQNANPGQAPMTGMMGALSLQVDFPLDADAAALPGSALARRASTRVKLEVNGAKPPFALRSWSSSSAHRDVNLELKGKAPRRIPELTLVIRQRVDRKKLPFALTVPIEAGPPAGR